MADGRDDQVIVVTVLSGREFPRRAHQSLLVLGKFDGEELSADPVRHDSSFEVQNELAWVVSRRALHQHRMQRTPVKLQVFSVDHTTYARVLVGYIVLSLRTAQQAPPQAKWYRVLNCVYKKSKPELQVIISMEDVDTETAAATAPVDEANPVNEAAAVQGDAPTGQLHTRDEAPLSTWQRQANDGDAEAPPTNPDAILGPDGIYQVGGGLDAFVWSVTVSGASDLTDLANPELSDSASFHFRYDLLGNPVATESFGSLSEPSFAAER